MEYYKRVAYNNAPIEEILSLIEAPESPGPNVGFVGRLDDEIQEKIFDLLEIDKSLYPGRNILLVYFEPKTSIVIHSDNRRDVPTDTQINQTLILPLKNCEDLKWFWHEVVNPDAIFDYGEKKKFNAVPSIKVKDARPIHSIYCTGPFISNVKQWHNLTNTGDKIAIGISLRLLPWSNQLDLSLPQINCIVDYDK